MRCVYVYTASDTQVVDIGIHCIMRPGTRYVIVMYDIFIDVRHNVYVASGNQILDIYKYCIMQHSIHITHSSDNQQLYM